VRTRHWMLLGLSLGAGYGCAGTEDDALSPPANVRAEALRADLECGPIVPPVFPPPVGDTPCRSEVETDPNVEVTVKEVPCNSGQYTTFIGIRNFEASFNVMSHRSWSTGVCDWGHLRGGIDCVADLATGEASDDDSFSDSYDIVIPPSEYSSTSVNVTCPSHIPFVARASLHFMPEGTVPIVEEP
jgi:hypothetical protein